MGYLKESFKKGTISAILLSLIFTLSACNVNQNTTSIDADISSSEIKNTFPTFVVPNEYPEATEYTVNNNYCNLFFKETDRYRFISAQTKIYKTNIVEDTNISLIDSSRIESFSLLDEYVFYTVAKNTNTVDIQCSLWKIPQAGGTAQKLMDFEQSYVVDIIILDNIIGLDLSSSIKPEEEDTQATIKNDTTITRRIDYYTFDETTQTLVPKDDISDSLKNHFKIAANKQLYFDKITQKSDDDYESDKSWSYNGLFVNDAFYEISYENKIINDSATIADNIYFYKKSYNDEKEELLWQIDGKELEEKHRLESTLTPFNYDEDWIYLITKSTTPSTLHLHDEDNPNPYNSWLYRLSKSGDKLEQIINLPEDISSLSRLSSHAVFLPFINIANGYIYYINTNSEPQFVKMETRRIE